MAAASNACNNPPTVDELWDGGFAWQLNCEPVFHETRSPVMELPWYFCNRIARLWSGRRQSCWFMQFVKDTDEWKQRHFRVPGFNLCNSFLLLSIFW